MTEQKDIDNLERELENAKRERMQENQQAQERRQYRPLLLGTMLLLSVLCIGFVISNCGG